MKSISTLYIYIYIYIYIAYIIFILYRYKLRRDSNPSGGDAQVQGTIGQPALTAVQRPS